MRRLLAPLLLVLHLTVAQAGQTCRDEPPTVAEIEQGMAMAQATQARLDASGADVVLLARAGQNLQSYGLRWSHMAFAYRSAEGPWRVLHKLNPCGSDRGFIYRQGLGEFFLDKPWRYEAAFVVPKAEIQQALLPLLRDNGRVLSMDEPHYSMVAYSWGQRFQQSNQWVMETLALGASPEAWNRATAQDWLRGQGYQPQVLYISALTRLGAETTLANISFNDHPSGDRFAGRIATTTVDSVFRWMPRAGLSGPVQVVRP